MHVLYIQDSNITLRKYRGNHNSCSLCLNQTNKERYDFLWTSASENKPPIASRKTYGIYPLALTENDKVEFQVHTWTFLFHVVATQAMWIFHSPRHDQRTQRVLFVASKMEIYSPVMSGLFSQSQ